MKKTLKLNQCYLSIIERSNAICCYYLPNNHTIIYSFIHNRSWQNVNDNKQNKENIIDKILNNPFSYVINLNNIRNFINIQNATTIINKINSKDFSFLKSKKRGVKHRDNHPLKEQKHILFNKDILSKEFIYLF